MGIKKQDLLNEVMGVPRAIERWVDFFVQANVYLTEHAVENQDNAEWEERSGTVAETGEKITFLTTKLGISNTLPIIKEFFGVSSNEELLENEDFKKLPLWNPEISCEIMVIPDDAFEIFEKSGQYNAYFGIDDKTTKLAEIGKHRVLSKTVFGLNVTMSASDADNHNFEKIIRLAKPTMAHELTHAYQKYKMFEKEDEFDFGREGVLNSVINRQKTGNITPEWGDLTYLIYTHLSFEVNARVTQLYYELQGKGVKTKEEIIKAIKESTLWEMMEKLRDFDAKKFIDEHTEIDPFFGMMFGIEQKITNKMMGRDFEFGDIQNKKDLLKYFIKLWDSDIQSYVKHHKDANIPTPIMDVVPKKALEDPMVFLKFWEKRFHRKAEEYRRKLLRVGQLLLNDIKEKNKVTKNEREN